MTPKILQESHLDFIYSFVAPECYIMHEKNQNWESNWKRWSEMGGYKTTVMFSQENKLK
jgi:hypothetical protein